MEGEGDRGRRERRNTSGTHSQHRSSLSGRGPVPTYPMAEGIRRRTYGQLDPLTPRGSRSHNLSPRAYYGREEHKYIGELGEGGDILKHRDLHDQIDDLPYDQGNSISTSNDIINAGKELEECFPIEEHYSLLEHIPNSPDHLHIYLYQKNMFGVKWQLSLPDQVHQLIDDAKDSQGKDDGKVVTMGIWREVDIVFVAVFNTLILWNYSNSHIEHYNTGAQDIITIELFPTIHTIRQYLSKETRYLVAIASVGEVRLFSLELKNERKPQYNLKVLNLDVSTDNICVSKLITSREGRLFYGAKDGHINELEYIPRSQGYILSRDPHLKRTDHDDSWWRLLVKNIGNPEGEWLMDSLVVDNSRHILYALIRHRKKIEKSHIKIVDLGPLGQQYKVIEKIGFDKLEQIHRMCINKMTGDIKFEDLRIMSIAAIERNISNSLHLVCLLACGIRVYISIGESSPLNLDKSGLKRYIGTRTSKWEYIIPPNYYGKRPTKEIWISHIRIPPAYTHRQGERQRDIIAGTEGVPMAAQPPDPSSRYDKIYLLSNSKSLLVTQSQSQSEGVSSSRVIGYNRRLVNENMEEEMSCCAECKFPTKVADVKEVTVEMICQDNANIQTLLQLQSGKGGMPNAHPILTINSKYSPSCMGEDSLTPYMPCYQLLVLTNTSLTCYYKLRSIDRLFIILNSLDETYMEHQFHAFREQYTLVHVCSDLLTLACEKNERHPVPEFMLGDLQRQSAQSPEDQKYVDVPINAFVVRRAGMLFFEYGRLLERHHESEIKEKKLGRPIIPLQGRGVIGGVYTPNYYDALWIHATRILRPIWELPLTRRKYGEYRNQFQTLDTFHKNTILEKLEGFNTFLKDYSTQMSSTIDITKNAPKEISQAELQIIISDEYAGLDRLKLLILRNIHALQLLQHISKEDTLYEIIKHYSSDVKTISLLSDITFRELITTEDGQNCCQILISQYLAIFSDQRPLHLHKLCPSFYDEKASYIDEAQIKLRVNIGKITNHQGKLTENQKIDVKSRIQNAVKMLEKYPDKMDINEVIQLLARIGEYESIVRICLSRYMSLVNINMRKSGKLVPKEFQVQEEPALLYLFYLLDTIQESMKSTYKHPAPQKRGIYYNASILPQEEKVKLLDYILNSSFECDSLNLHFKLLRWLEKYKIVFNSRSIYEKDYLLQQMHDQPREHIYSTKLFKYYEENGKYKEAFEIAYNLALLDETRTVNGEIVPFDGDLLYFLDKREEYGGWAKMVANRVLRTATSTVIDESSHLDEWKSRKSLIEETLIIIGEQKLIYKELRGKYDHFNKKGAKIHKEYLARLNLDMNLIQRKVFDCDTLYYLFARFHNLSFCLLSLIKFLPDSHMKYQKEINTIIKEMILEEYHSREESNEWPTNVKRVINRIHEEHPPKSSLLFGSPNSEKEEIKKYNLENMNFPIIWICKIVQELNLKHFGFDSIRYKMVVNNPKEALKNPYWINEYLVSDLQFKYEEVFNVHKIILSDCDKKDYEVYLFSSMTFLLLLQIWVEQIDYIFHIEKELNNEYIPCWTEFDNNLPSMELKINKFKSYLSKDSLKNQVDKLILDYCKGTLEKLGEGIRHINELIINAKATRLSNNATNMPNRGNRWFTSPERGGTHSRARSHYHQRGADETQNHNPNTINVINNGLHRLRMRSERPRKATDGRSRSGSRSGHELEK